jgi:hypothetical protein
MMHGQKQYQSGKHVLRKQPLVLTIHFARFYVPTAVLLKLPTSGTCCCVIGVVLAVSDISNGYSVFHLLVKLRLFDPDGKDVDFWITKWVQNILRVGLFFKSC